MNWLPLSQNEIAIVDAEDYARCAQFKWSLMRTPHTCYAYRKDGADTIYLHRFIVGALTGIEIDHIDRDGLNCRRYNMRVATRVQNARNRIVPQTVSGSGYRGVTRRDTIRESWAARIMSPDRVRINLGAFDTREEAARAYDAAARRLHGEHAVLNFPGDSDADAC